MSRPINISDTLTFIPSSYENTGSYNFTQGTTENGYANADNTTYNRLTLARNNKSTRQSQLYFNFDMSALSSIPSGATITSVSSNVKYYISSTSYVTAVSIRLYSGTTAKGTATTQRPTSATKYSITPGTWTLSELQNARLYVSATHNASNRDAYLYFYGADLSVSYELNGIEYEVSVTNNSEAVSSISPSGTTYITEGGNYTLRIDTDDISSIEVLDGTTNVTSLFQQQTVSTSAESTVLGTYALVSGSFNSSAESYFSGLSGNGVDATQTTSNYYSSNSGITVVFTYYLIFNNIPSNATITRLYVDVNGHAESTSEGTEYMCAQLISGSTTLSEELNFKDVGTSNSTQTIEATTLPTISQLSSLKLQCRLGYYGGAINGATCYIEYSVPLSTPYYTYTIANISADHIISISDASSEKLYIKIGGEYKKARKIFKKISGVWTEVSLDTLNANNVYFYGGINGEEVYEEYGVVEKTATETTITLDDTGLAPGTYTLIYEDSTRTQIPNVDNITTIAVS